MKQLTAVLLLFGLATVVACTNDKTCSDSTPSPNLRIELWSAAINTKTKKRDTFLYTLPDTITVIGQGQKDSLETRVVNRSSFSIPLNFLSDTSVFYFKFKTKGIRFQPVNPPVALKDSIPSTIYWDTVAIKYQVTPTEFISQACGFKHTFTNISIKATKDPGDTTHRILAILDPIPTELTNDASTPIRILVKYHTDSVNR